MAGGDPAKVIVAAEHSLDSPTVLVAALIILDRALAVATTEDHRDRALLAQGHHDPVGIINPAGCCGKHHVVDSADPAAPLGIDLAVRPEVDPLAHRAGQKIENALDAIGGDAAGEHDVLA